MIVYIPNQWRERIGVKEGLKSRFVCRGPKKCKKRFKPKKNLRKIFELQKTHIKNSELQEKF